MADQNQPDPNAGSSRAGTPPGSTRQIARTLSRTQFPQHATGGPSGLTTPTGSDQPSATAGVIPVTPGAPLTVEPRVPTEEQTAEMGLYRATRTQRDTDPVYFETLQYYLDLQRNELVAAIAASQEAMRETLAKMIEEQMALNLTRMAEIVDARMNEYASIVEEKLRNLRSLNQGKHPPRNPMSGRNPKIVGSSEETPPQFPRNEVGSSSSSVPVAPVTRGPRPSLLYAGNPAVMGSGNVEGQHYYAPIDDATDTVTPTGLGPAVPGLVPLQTLQEPFKEVISYRAYRLINTRQKSTFDEITQMSKLRRSIQFTFPNLQPFSGAEAIKLLSFLRDFKYACDNRGIHEEAAVRDLTHFLTGDARRFYASVVA